MKKFFLALICSVGLLFSAYAYTMYGGFSAKANGQTIARIELSANGSCSIVNYETNDQLNGTYHIERQPTPGDSGIPITFNLNGQRYTGTMLWPTSGKLSIILDGLVFESSRR
ncbi:MAG: hypothetical protein NC453_28300 [Muribaculum sp.]|nr:hypothetical protein [Muribaculum sp.]